MPATKSLESYNVNVLNAGWSLRTDRFYPVAALRNIHKQFSPGLGEFMFSGDNVDLRLILENTSHRTNRLYLKNNDTELWAEIQILDTRCGRLVRDFIKGGHVKFDCLMLGTINAYSEVNPDSVQYLRIAAYGVYK